VANECKRTILKWGPISVQSYNERVDAVPGGSGTTVEPSMVQRERRFRQCRRSRVADALSARWNRGIQWYILGAARLALSDGCYA
jgi:hypothetical protein